MKKQILTVALLVLLLGISVNLKSDCCISFIDNVENKELIEKIKLKEVFDNYNMVEYFNEEDRRKVEKIAKRFNVRTEDLCLLFYIESRGNPKAINKLSRASGLIQWLQSTAVRFETTLAEIRQMSTSDQLDLVERYLEFWEPKNGYSGFTDLYLSVFYPAALGKSNNYVIGPKGSLAVKLNKGVDRNKDGILTVGDVKNFIS